MHLLEHSATHTTCPWKGEASVVAGGEKNKDAAWYYPAAAEIKDYIAFWKGVEVVS